MAVHGHTSRNARREDSVRGSTAGMRAASVHAILGVVFCACLQAARRVEIAENRARHALNSIWLQQQVWPADAVQKAPNCADLPTGPCRVYDSPLSRIH